MKYEEMVESLRRALIKYARDCAREFACNVTTEGVCEDGERLTLREAFDVVSTMLPDPEPKQNKASADLDAMVDEIDDAVGRFLKDGRASS